jgi:hypothetical protein
MTDPLDAFLACAILVGASLLTLGKVDILAIGTYGDVFAFALLLVAVLVIVIRFGIALGTLITLVLIVTLYLVGLVPFLGSPLG